ncbi:MAG: Aspartate aminotransferase [Candidatus Bathyarchaeota archaeon BA2]|nr:MAG: Aspartate aminotransferase [Candidatus Bathyarchaeota archaeon BA2]
MDTRDQFPSGVTKVKIEELVRKEILGLPLYEAGSILPRKLDEKVTRLDLNENFAVAGDIVGKLLLEVCQDVDVRLYPPLYGAMAVKAISEFFGFSESEIFVGNGVDGVLDSLMKVFVKKESKVLVVEPTFPLYAYFTQLYGGKKVTVLLRPNFELDVDGMLEKCDEQISLFIICSPNNPTGNQFKKEDLEKILREFKGVVVVDEAYVDFAKYTVIDWTRKFENLVVLRSFSKSFGLAGIRAGFLVSNKSIAEYVKRVTNPFEINIVTQRLIALALQNWNYFQQRIKYIIKEREWLRDALAKTDGVTPYPSDANFILFKITKDNLSSSTVKEKLESRDVLVKDRSNLPLLENCIRVTVGTRSMNETFVSALKDALEEQ